MLCWECTQEAQDDGFAWWQVAEERLEAAVVCRLGDQKQCRLVLGEQCRAPTQVCILLYSLEGCKYLLLAKPVKDMHAPDKKRGKESMETKFTARYWVGVKGSRVFLYIRTYCSSPVQDPPRWKLTIQAPMRIVFPNGWVGWGGRCAAPALDDALQTVLWTWPEFLGLLQDAQNHLLTFWSPRKQIQIFK